MSEKQGNENPFHYVEERADCRSKVVLRLKLLSLALLISLPAYSWYKNQSYHTPRISGDNIKWTPCGENIECGRLNVPLDYANPGAGTASLTLARYPATNKDGYLGTLLTNPGGPGGSGVSFIYRAGKRVSDLVDGRYDIVSWDPRGINGTTPRVECFASETEQEIFFANSHEEVVPTTRNLSDPIDYAVYRSQIRIADSRNKALAQICQKRSGEALRHVGTATVVRDLELLFRTLEGDEKKVNFYGYSYGTIVGSYLVNMFPDRVGKVVIDGVVDPDLWANSHSVEWLKYDFVDTEKGLGNFFKGCAEAGPERCALASHGLTAEDLSATFQTLLDKLYEKPLPVINADRFGVLTEGSIRGLVFSYLYRPRDWPKLATLLSAVLNGDGGPIVNETISRIEMDSTKPAKTALAIWAVTCTDTPSFEGVTADEAFEDMLDEITKAQKVSPLIASLQIDMCQHWRARETERFTGPFNHSLSNPILVIGNTADPITPVVNARAVKRSLGDSARLIVQDGSGHCSSAMASLCTAKAIKSYFLDNELPKDGLECSTDEQLFPPPPSDPTDSTFWVDSIQQMSAEDLDLLQKIRDLGEAVSDHTSMFKAPRQLIRY